MNNKIKFALLTSAMTLGLAACQDDWDDHYGQTADAPLGTASLYEVMLSHPELSDFCKVLENTKVFSNCRQTDVTYATLLGNDQFFTVWAPVNGTFNRDSLIELCKTTTGDSLVELHFVKNHVARYAHSVDASDKKIYMFNDKTIEQTATTFNDIPFEKTNIAARNGVLHTMQQKVPYYYNIYEALIGLDEYKHIGDFLHSYQVDKLNEAASLAKGIVDGKTVYIDSVFYSVNSLLTDYSYGVLNAEDSTYWALIPSKELWDSLYAEAETYFNYVAVDKADSLHERFAHYALMQDLFYNPKAQFSPDYYFASTTWTYRKSDYSTIVDEDLYKHHVYWYPFDPDNGLFHPSAWSGTQQCSNGWIYKLDKWPSQFQKELLYFYPIERDIESSEMTFDEGVKNKKLTVEVVSSKDPLVHKNYISVTPQTQTDPYYVDCKIPNVLSGTYDIYVEFLPRNINPTLPFDEESTAGKRNRRPAKFIAEITYQGTDGKLYTVDSRTRYKIDPENPSYYVKGSSADDYLFDCNESPTTTTRAFSNDPLVKDKVKLCTMTFPTCSYNLEQATTSLKLKNAITSKEANKFWGVWFIDRVIFEPHMETTEADN